VLFYLERLLPRNPSRDVRIETCRLTQDLKLESGH
jgi:hypothetical protein